MEVKDLKQLMHLQAARPAESWIFDYFCCSSNKSCVGGTRNNQQKLGFLILFAVMLVLCITPPVKLVCVCVL